MEDLVIDACRWHVDAESHPYKKRALEHFRERYTVLLDWMRSEGLLKTVNLGVDVDDWMTFEFHSSDLTDEGYELVRECHGSWEPSFGQASTKRHLVQWKRKLAAMRSNNG